MPYISTAAPGAGGDEEDPCKHEKNNKKKYVVYFGVQEDDNKYYTGRSSGELTQAADSIVTKRLSVGYPAGKKYPERKITKLYPIHETESYAAVRGAEEKHQKFFAKHGVGAQQDNPINPRHNSKTDYEECAKKTFPNCPVCGA
jgi:hypothetical protein